MHDYGCHGDNTHNEDSNHESFIWTIIVRVLVKITAVKYVFYLMKNISWFFEMDKRDDG